jgi:hypothetical protein
LDNNLVALDNNSFDSLAALDSNNSSCMDKLYLSSSF